jgi:hypothetical protein
MPDIKDQKLLYHLTSIKNIDSILRIGLMPRAQLNRFEDVADSEILVKRRVLGLENYVPFHWFSRNPFDGGVQAARTDEHFVLVTVHRSLAKAKNWKIIPRHPLAKEDIHIMDYQDGFEAIDWEVMNRRVYHDAHCKSVCMAECLSPDPVPTSDFFRIYVSNEEVERFVLKTIRSLNLLLEVDVNRGMFLN